MKTEEIKLYECKPYSARMSKTACRAMKKKAHMPKTKIMFLHFNELTFCRTCSGVK